MDLQPFPVRADNPDFVIIEFFDNSLGAQIAPDLAAMAGAADANVAVLAVTDDLIRPALVIEITANTQTLLETLGKIDTGNPGEMADLLARALNSYPNAPHVAIGFAGHGTGVFDEIDPEPFGQLFRWPRPPSIPSAHSAYQSLLFYSLQLERGSGRLLTTKELGVMLRDGFARAGRSGIPVDLIFFDTCLNGMIELITEIEEFADCIVGSTDLQPITGWNYQEWFSRMKSAPPEDGIAWGRLAVEAMQATYARQAERPITLSSVHARSSVTQCFAELVRRAERAEQAGFRYLEWARSQAQDFGGRLVDSYDLCDFAVHLARNREIEEIALAADALVAAIGRAVSESIAFGPPRANGLAFWFPALRSAYARDVNSYRGLTFDIQTRWSFYLETYR